MVCFFDIALYTTKAYMKNVTVIDVHWITEILYCILTQTKKIFLKVWAFDFVNHNLIMIDRPSIYVYSTKFEYSYAQNILKEKDLWIRLLDSLV